MVMLAIAAWAPSAHAWKPEIGEVPGEIESYEYIDGTPFSLQTLRGKPAVLYFGADWCGPCVELRPFIKSFTAKYASTGLQFVVFASDDNGLRGKWKEHESDMGVRAVMADLKVCPVGECRYGYRRGNFGAFGRLYRVPTAITVDAAGVVRAKFEGEIAAKLPEAVDKLLAK